MKNKQTVKVEYTPSGSDCEDSERYLDSLGPVTEKELFEENEEAPIE
jgi:hypothetical protein